MGEYASKPRRSRPRRSIPRRSKPHRSKRIVKCLSDTWKFFIGWKKARKTDNTFTVTLVKLLIPEDAKRSSATSAKCRCNKAQVLEITSLDGKESYDTTTSSYDKTFIYKGWRDRER